MDLIGKLHERSPLFLSREEFEATLDGWTLDPVERNGEVIGVFVVKGPEFHFDKWDDTSADRAILRKYPGSLVEQYGYAVTRTPKDDHRQLAFNRRLGFEPIAEDEYDVIQRITRERFTRRVKCQSQQ
jgi:hypothetical protein